MKTLNFSEDKRCHAPGLAESMVNHGAHDKPFRQEIFFFMSAWKKSLLFSIPIFKDHLVDDFPTQDTTPPEELFTGSVEFFENHDPSAPMTLHDNLPITFFFENIRPNPYFLGKKFYTKWIL